MAKRISKLVSSGLTGKDLTLPWFTKRIQPLQHREQLMYLYSGRKDKMRATKDNLSSDALDKRLRVMIKIPREVHSHACGNDIYTGGAGPFFDSLEEKDLGFLVRTPITGPSNPEPASDADKDDETEPILPSKRKRESDSGNTSQRGHGVRGLKTSSATTKTLEKEKLRLKEIDTSKKGGIEYKKSREKPNKKAKLSPATMPNTPEVEAPSKPALPIIPTKEKDVIQIDDDTEDVGGSSKVTSTSMPSTEEQQKTSAEAPVDDASQREEVAHELLAKRPSVDDISAKLKMLEAMHESVQASLNESQENETKLKKELEAKHALAMVELEKKLKVSDEKVNSLSSQLKIAEAEAKAVDDIIFPALGFVRNAADGLTQTEAYNKAGKSIKDLMGACRKVAENCP
ncbi:hypothetical protein ACQ4PT_017027 [Festuca glaucescens]